MRFRRAGDCWVDVEFGCELREPERRCEGSDRAEGLYDIILLILEVILLVVEFAWVRRRGLYFGGERRDVGVRRVDWLDPLFRSFHVAPTTQLGKVFVY